MKKKLFSTSEEKKFFFDKVYNSEGKLIPARFTTLYEDILYYAGVVIASEFIQYVKENSNSDELQRRIVVAEKQYREIEKYFKNKEEVKSSGLYDITELDCFEISVPIILEDMSKLKNLNSNRYLIKCKENGSIKFENIFLDNSKYGYLKNEGFDKKNLRNYNDVFFRISNNVSFSAFDHNFYAVIDGNSYYDRKNCARLAKLTNVNFIAKKQNEKIKEAIILPIAHTDKNYFYHLTEMWYGLNYIKYFNKDLPIIYTGDTFELLDFFCEKLKINKSRLKSFKQMENTVVEKVYHFSPMAYLWDESFFEFFKNLNPYNKPNFKIFIANPQGTNELKNKEEVFVLLRKMGFLIIHPQDLKMKKMIDLFQKASIVLCQSNVILTNTAFMKSGTHLIEILDEKNISSEFYLRTRFNKMEYSCLVPNSGVVDINELEKIIAKHLYLETKGALNHE